MAAVVTKLNIEIFIDEVKKFPCLYNKKMKKYRDINLKQALWSSIGAKFGLSASEASQKWKVQRDRYMKERKKAKYSVGTSEIYVPQWYLYNMMNNLLSPTAHENTSPDDSMVVDDSALYEGWSEASNNLPQSQNMVDEGIIENNENVTLVLDFEAEEHSPLQQEQTLPASTSTTRSSNPGKRKLVEDEEKHLIQTLNSTTKCVADYFASKTTKQDVATPVDVYTLFGELLVYRLRNLDKKRARKAMREIELVMHRYEIEEDDDM